MTNPWIEALRLRTLPVGISGVAAGCACAIHFGSFNWMVASICLAFAVLAQISSNFANEYFDFRNGIDKPGREGFRRGVSEGDISPKAMKAATFISLLAACAIGCMLIPFGGWWLIPVGLLIAIFALAYSTGPWPLSQHALGDVAVFIFYGLVPVWFTAWLQTGKWDMWPTTPAISIAIGLMGVNVLIINNYRDMEDDQAVGKTTTVTLFGRNVMHAVYLFDTVCAALLVFAALWDSNPLTWLIPAVYLLIGIKFSNKLKTCRGKDLNSLLKFTSLTMVAVALLLIPAMLWQ